MLLTFIAALLYIPSGIFSYAGIYISVIILALTKYDKYSFSLFLFGAGFSFLFLLCSFLFTSGFSLLTLYAITIFPLMTRLNLKVTSATVKILLSISFVCIFSFVVPLDVDASTWFGIFYDRNVFGLIMLPFFFALSRYYRFGIFLSVLLAVMLGSRNVLLAVLIERVLSNMKFFRFLYRKIPRVIAISFILLPILALVFLFIFSGSFNFASDREYLRIFDASNLARATGMMHGLEFLYTHPNVILFGNGWADYLLLGGVHAHNDFVRFVIKHGVLVLLYFLFFFFKAYKYYRIDGSIVTSYIIFSGILGGVGWGLGYYWLIISIFLFSERSVKIMRKNE
ncbi:hypothetical protein [Marinomonas sp.]